MAIRSSSSSRIDQSPREMFQRSNSNTSSSPNIVGSLLKSWKKSTDSFTDSKKHSSRNSPSARHMSPLRAPSHNGSQTHLHHHNHHLHHTTRDKYFKDLDEDWSAVIDDYNMPIPMINNGGIETTLRPPAVIQDDRAIESQKSSMDSYQGTIPNLNRTISNDLKLQYQIEVEKDVQELNSLMVRIEKFKKLIKPKDSTTQVNLPEIRKLAWNGIPMVHRPVVWKLLIGYLPSNLKRQEQVLNRKRLEYKQGVDHIFSDNHEKDVTTWHQIEIDIPRTNPHIPLYQFESVHNSLKRILYFWAIRHPASGYVQGINDLVTPFFQVFLSEYLSPSAKDDVYSLDPLTYLTAEQLSDVEADCFWCLSKLLEQITDYFIHGQPGILKQVKHLSQLVKRIDCDLFSHFESEHVEFLQFSVRWMNCLLMREFQMSMVIRMWDTYLSETSLETSIVSEDLMSDASTSLDRKSRTSSSGPSSSDSRQTTLSEFHVFVCAAFLVKWSDELMKMDFQEIITFLQNPPTKSWKESDIEMLLSEAYIWQSLYKDATSHWR
ncbi:GTPase-activating protein GYP1 [Kluyveromyces lactis]|uniref:KLLA0A07975p n=1 Tax=Kluyveromyces lactis (strain ATCC 8585 / CBS 2359 / DSM 70799 / NBRC 1267 / NRRL Y-1140 / WM37) TaxID=284590 RepID=Q6CXI4_KLULA|nr:uncharacterized protein KLLA0_A07975g [Kluyveromyces lactis]CAH02943.1 KLLA0A07975p [Kluyveromyces lactis]|eukprot:XP_451355.1 uncharacterized protein KLLA0_A07975g [Kluyveromyces lactis]